MRSIINFIGFIIARVIAELIRDLWPWKYLVRSHGEARAPTLPYRQNEYRGALPQICG